MRVTIIPDENRVNVEGFSETVDCSALFNENIHAVQWYGTHGEIEFWHPPGTTKFRANEAITDFTPYQKYVEAWEVAANAA